MAGDVTLRDLTAHDLPFLFEMQRDPEGVRMAAFTVEDPSDSGAFLLKWAKLLLDETVVRKAILLDGELVGSVASFIMFGAREVSYWIARERWGQGIATRALSTFLSGYSVRPLHARAAKDNVGSIRVLRKCGFETVGEDRGFAHGRGAEVEEFLFRLQAP